MIEADANIDILTEHIEAKQEEQEEVEEDIKAKSSATKVTKKAKKDEEPAAAKANLKYDHNKLPSIRL